MVFSEGIWEHVISLVLPVLQVFWGIFWQQKLFFSDPQDRGVNCFTFDWRKLLHHSRSQQERLAFDIPSTNSKRSWKEWLFGPKSKPPTSSKHQTDEFSGMSSQSVLHGHSTIDTLPTAFECLKDVRRFSRCFTKQTSSHLQGEESIVTRVLQLPPIAVQAP